MKKYTYVWNNHTTKESERFYHGDEPDEFKLTRATFLLRDENEALTALEIIRTVLKAECNCRKVEMYEEEQ